MDYRCSPILVPPELFFPGAMGSESCQWVFSGGVCSAQELAKEAGPF
jgi:hypothetical protein